MSLKITKLKKKKAVYDITVENNENFFANDILVHNCIEIMEPTDDTRTAVCCLSSLNAEKYDEWKNTNLAGDVTRFLDNVLQYFIDNGPSELGKAIFSATQERSIGLGVMGFHSYLQKKGIPFESETASDLSNAMFKDINEKSLAESKKLAVERGEAPDMKGSGLRFANRIAIAPNANSSSLCDTSPSIEPWKANAFTHRTRAGSHLIKNKHLEEILEFSGNNTDSVWASIISNGGSVQHLDFLSWYVKDIYKTAIEIDQFWVVKHAAERQQFICQGQSLNLFFPAGAEKKYLHDIHTKAWREGLKGLYYLRTEASGKAENISLKVEKDRLEEFDDDADCEACQG